MELTSDLWWRVGLWNDKRIEIGKFGEIKPYIISTKPSGATNIRLLTEPKIDYDFEDVINVATTNVADNGEEDLNNTLGQPHTVGMNVCGVTSQVNPYDKIAYVDVKGVKVAFIAGAEGVVSEEGRYDINTIDENLVISQIEEAKSNGAMAIVVSLNFADNGQNSLENDKMDFFNHLGAAGANLVLCSLNFFLF